MVRKTAFEKLVMESEGTAWSHSAAPNKLSRAKLYYYFFRIAVEYLSHPLFLE